MSSASLFAFLGIGAISGWVYTFREHYLPMKDQVEKGKERIQTLEEEIVRLKREMRICGIPVPSSDSPDSPVSPGSSIPEA